MRVLLDTHAIVWLDGGESMRRAAIEAIEQARNEDQVFVSPISFWEITQLAELNRLR